MPALKTFLMIAALMSVACRSAPKPAKASRVVWRPLGSWTGHGNTQTDSFEMGNAEWRIKWETSHETSPPGTGTFKVEVHSAISGRPLIYAVDHKGVGHDIEYVTEDPRLFYLVIESGNLDWAISVEESVVIDAK
jgi:hypothetical protein